MSLQESDEPQAALLAKQCWLMASESSEASKQCQKLLKDLGEAVDASMPEMLDIAAHIAPSSGSQVTYCEASESFTSYVQSIEVKGSSLKEVNGFYEPTRAISNHRPIFQNLHGFSMSLEVLSSKSSTKRGWVIGKEAVGFYGITQLSASNSLPLEDGKWFSFPAAQGTAVPNATAKIVPMDPTIQKGQGSL